MRNLSTGSRGILLAAATLLLIPSLTPAQTSNVQPRITAAIDEANLTTLRGNTHPLARPEFDRGPAPASLPMERMLLVLKRSAAQETALDALLDQQQDKSSPNYHQWLTPQQFGQQFGPADQDIQTVTSWLQSHGFQVNRVSNGRTVIEFTGTAGQVREAFHTEIHRYTVNNEDHWANSSDPQIPTALTPVVAGIDTLYNFPRQQMHELVGVFSRTRATGAVKPDGTQFTFPNPCNPTSQPYCDFAVAPADFAKIYDVPNLLLSPAPPTQFNGDNITIAIVAQSDITTQDVAAFRTLFGLPAPKLNTIVDGPDPGVNIEQGETEADLDVQWSGAVAPNATIDLVVSQSTEASLGADLSAQYAVDNNLAPILNESFGVCELFIGTAGNTFYDQLWQQAAAQGITVTVSSGDAGSALCDRNAGTVGAAEFGLSVNGFTSTPYNVSVGGTDFNDINSFSTFWNTTPNDTPTVASAKGYIPEMTWNDTCTNQELFSFFGTTTAEQDCNNTNVQQDGLVDVAGGGGGQSNCTTSDGQDQTSCGGGYAKPSWQTALTPNDGKRDIPDVALFASNGFNSSFYLICESDLNPGATSCDPYASVSDFVGIGGTSASSPAFAGIMALVNQADSGSRQGNANYILYKLAAKSGASCTSSASPASSCVFYDVPSGSTIAMPCAKNSPNCTISNGNDSIGVLSGYAATAGYDLATGLGSVNANNLVKAWATAETALKSSATALTLNSGSAVNITHGQSVNVGISVTGTGGTPTGNVSLIANTAPPSAPTEVTQQGVQGFALTNGSVSSTTNALPGGTYTVVAQYPGDGTFGSSTSAPPVNVAVGPEPSKTFANLVTLDINGNLTSFSASSANYGSGYYFLRVDVGNSSASVSPSTGISSTCSNGTSNCPTGTVTLSSSGTPLSTGSLMLNSRGYAEIQSLTVGTYAISSSYGGDSSYQPSAAAPLNFTVAKGPTTAAAGVAGSPVQYGNLDEVTATVLTTSDGAAPTGSFAFFLDGSPLTTSSLVYEGFPYPSGQPPSYATLSASGSAAFLSQGNHTLTVQYSGDANYAGSTSPPTTISVTKAQPFFTTYGANPGTVNVNQQVTLVAQMSGSDEGVAPTGTMTFSVDSNAVSGTVTYTPSAHGLSASMPYTPTVVGSHSITVSYSGDENYSSASTPTAATLTVNGPTFTVTANPTTIPVSPPGAMGSTTLTFTAQNGFSSGGSVAITPMCSGLPAETTCSSGASITLATNGTATATVTFLTTAPSAAVPISRNRPNMPGWRTTATTMAVICLLWMSLLLRGRDGKRRRRDFAFTFVAFVLLAVSAGCGGGGGGGGVQNQGTPPGNYTGISVTVTINGVTQTVANLTLNVQ
jgi:hypothetical protein